MNAQNQDWIIEPSLQGRFMVPAGAHHGDPSVKREIHQLVWSGPRQPRRGLTQAPIYKMNRDSAKEPKRLNQVNTER